VLYHGERRISAQIVREHASRTPNVNGVFALWRWFLMIVSVVLLLLRSAWDR
jgi:hypothetical protein